MSEHAHLEARAALLGGTYDHRTHTLDIWQDDGTCIFLDPDTLEPIDDAVVWGRLREWRNKHTFETAEIDVTPHRLAKLRILAQVAIGIAQKAHG